MVHAVHAIAVAGVRTDAPRASGAQADEQSFGHELVGQLGREAFAGDERLNGG